MAEGRLLVPAMQAARNLGIARRTLRRHIRAGLIKATEINSRIYIPQIEIDRLVNGHPRYPTEIQGLSLPVQSATLMNVDASGLIGQMTAAERYEALKKTGAPAQERFAALMEAMNEEMV